MLPRQTSKKTIIFYGSSLEEAIAFSSSQNFQDQRLLFFSNRKFFYTGDTTALWEVHHPSEEVLKRLAWETLFHVLHVIFSKELKRQEREEGNQLIEHFHFLQRGAEAVLADVRDMGRKITGNIVRNLRALPKAHAFVPFYQSFKGIPAIICGAGPSLETSLSLLHPWRQNALIFAGGSALNALSHASIAPHFAAAIDPDPPRHLFREQSAVEAPLFYQNRVAHQLLKNCHGPHIFVPDNVSYPIEEWLMNYIKPGTAPFEAGWNVATFCLHLAVVMGCNPIVLTGVDLCEYDGKSYAEGVTMPKQSNVLVSLGEGKMAKSDFLLAAKWVEEFALSHPQITFINTSKSGLPLQGVKQVHPQNLNLPLSKVDLEGKIHSLLQKEKSLLTSEIMVTAAVERLKKNIDACFIAVEKMIDLLQSGYTEDPSTKGEFILLEVESEENPIYTYLLQPLWNIWQWLLLKPVQSEPYPGFTHRTQKLLFFQTALQELSEELIDAC